MNTSLTSSLIVPLEKAWAHTGNFLFKPFDLKIWLAVGFTCFLSQLSGYSSSFNGNFSPGEGSTNSSFSDAFAAIKEQLGEWTTPLLVAGGLLFVIVILFVIALAVVMMWLSCRGTFMFMDNVARSSAEIVRPWKEYAPQAWQLFWVWLALIGSIFVLAIGVGIGVAMMGVGTSWNPFVNNISMIWVLIFVILILVVLIGVVSYGFHALVIPRMYIKRCGVLPAVVDSWNLFLEHPWECIGFLLLNTIMGIAWLMLFLVSCLLTCCIAVLPYIHHVVFLPTYFFFKSYNLHFLAQFGDDWNAFPAQRPALPAA